MLTIWSDLKFTLDVYVGIWGYIMIKGGLGGANTKTGLIFEGKTDLKTFFEQQKGYSVYDSSVLYKGEIIAYIYKKYDFYRFLNSKGINWKEVISKRILPDNSIYVIVNNTLFIVECKFQQVGGSVDEKLQTCDFKKKQYKKLVSRLNISLCQNLDCRFRKIKTRK